MDRLRHLSEFWSWLPAFRAVAETEHLPTAASMMHVSPSALSRSVRLLEERLDVELFERDGRCMKLSPAGREFLAAVRDAMRRVDDGVATIRSTTLRGELRIASVGSLTALLLMPALARLRETHPEVHPEIDVGVPAAPLEDLLQGRLDLVLQTRAIAHPELCCERLLELELAVFCGAGHPLHDADTPLGLATVLEHEFVAPPGTPRDGRATDGWPVELPRRVGLTVDQVQSGCEACASGRYLAILPVLLVQRYAPGLRRLPIDVVPPLVGHAVHRSASRGALRADLELVAILRELAQPR